jgi:phosphoribosylformylglycinamidine synthase
MIPTEEDLKIQELLFSETQSRLIVTVAPENTKKFEEIFGYEDFALIGKVILEPEIRFYLYDEQLSAIRLIDLKESYKRTLGW